MAPNGISDTDTESDTELQMAFSFLEPIIYGFPIQIPNF